MTQKIRFFVPKYSRSHHYVASTAYLLRTSYDLGGKYPNDIEWLSPYSGSPTVEQLIEAFEKDPPDIVCCGVYIWNHGVLHEFACWVRETYPKTIIMAGGPDIDYKDFESYASKHWYYDYIIYGDGEDAFVKLIDRMLEGRTTELDLLQVPNLIFTTKKKIVKTPFEIYRGRYYTDVSPYLHCRDDFIKDVNAIKEAGEQPYVAWEFDRGCPYDCSFCDWKAGLYHKVTRRKYDFREEILLFAELGMILSFNNANFGIFEEDADVIEFIWQLETSGKYPCFDHLDPSWAKLNKERVHKIYALQKKYFNYIAVKPSLQTLTEEVLDNIDRPSIPWPEHKSMIMDFKKKESVPVYFSTHLITGMPGETRRSWDDVMLEIISLYPTNKIQYQPWHMLRNSPGADPEYQKKMKLNIIKSAMPYEDIRNICGYGPVYDEERWVEMLCKVETHQGEPMGYIADIVWGSYSHDIEDTVYMTIATGLIYQLQYLGNWEMTVERATKIYLSLRETMWRRAVYDADKMRRAYDKYGVLPFYTMYQNELWAYRSVWLTNYVSVSELLKVPK